MACLQLGHSRQAIEGDMGEWDILGGEIFGRATERVLGLRE